MNKYKKEAQDAKRKRQCERKASYPTEQLAQASGQRAYKCDYCGAWHRTGGLDKLVGQVQKLAARRGRKS